MAELTVFEAIENLRSTWRFKPDPVPEDHLKRILWAATRGPSGGNSQPWRFIVVRDREARQKLATLYWKAWSAYRPAVERAFGGLLAGQSKSLMGGAETLARNFANVPVHIVVGMKVPPPAFALRDERGALLDAGTIHASIYPAVQNLILAATALGLATRLLTLHRIVEAEIKALLRMPPDIETAALLPLGYPDGTFRRLPRLPVEAVTHWDHWGNLQKEKPRGSG